MALQTYDRGAIFAAGVMLAECTGFSVSHDSGNSPNLTMQKGFAGMTPGAQQTSISIESAAPRAGYDIDYLDKLANTEVVEVVYYGHGKKHVVNGYITKVDEKYGVGQASSASIEFMGGPVATSTF